MYKDIETQTSYNYLRQVIEELEEPVCILGGWAVFFHANDRFREAAGRPYLGSRDIDLGFSMSGEKTLAKSISVLTGKLGFMPQGYRYYKEVHSETGKAIGKNETVPSHNRFPMFVDLIVDSIPNDFRKRFGFDPIDEPLLGKAFAEGGHIILKEFSRKVLLPVPEVLLAMKINCLPERDKEHKKIKDLCDIFALAWYTDVKLGSLDLSVYSDKLNDCFKAISPEDYEKASMLLGNSPDEIERVVRRVCNG